MFLTESDTRVHQSLKLRLIVTVIGQITAPGQGNVLLAHQPLLVIAVAEAFVHIIAVQREGVLHIIAAEPLFVIGEARIGFYQVTRLRLRVRFKQAGVRQTRIRSGNAHYHVLPIVAGWHFKLLARLKRHRLT